MGRGGEKLQAARLTVLPGAYLEILPWGQWSSGSLSNLFPSVPVLSPSLTEAQLLWESYPDQSLLACFYNLLWESSIIMVFHFAKKIKFWAGLGKRGN